MIFVDTNILIDFLKGVPSVVSSFSSISPNNLIINNIVIMELYVGAKNKAELQFIQSKILRISVIDINQEIINLATNIIEQYSLSHHARIQDSIIAATCLVYHLPLWTHNRKDFRYIPGLELYRTRD